MPASSGKLVLRAMFKQRTNLPPYLRRAAKHVPDAASEISQAAASCMA